jgi:ABC-type transport system substrate-binding protein
MADSVKEKPASLRLVCPAEDADGFKLCNQMVEMVAGQGVILKLEQQPRSKILAEMTTPGSPPDFDLLYWYYDYPNESMSLAPFLDPTHNFMGYKPETDLDTPFRKLLSRSDFSEIRRLNHDLHEKFITRMPFIPLWQLDRHIAVHRTVRFDHIHPIAIFNDPARWSFDYLP